MMKSMNQEKSKLENMYSKWKELDMKSVSKKGTFVII